MKNINKHLLYNNIMRNVSLIVKQKLNEDLLSDLENDDDDSEFVYNHDKNIIKTFKGKPLALAMNSYNKIGDLLTYDELYNLFYIIKNNKSIGEVRKNLNTKNYGKIIGMCVGKGLWLSINVNLADEFVSFDDEFRKGCGFWRDIGTRLYRKISTSEDDGWYNTTYILKKYPRLSKDKRTLWYFLYNYEVPGLGHGICYSPALNQLKEIDRNNKIIKLDGTYWSSTQDVEDATCAYTYSTELHFADGHISSGYKDLETDILSLIHFE